MKILEGKLYRNRKTGRVVKVVSIAKETQKHGRSQFQQATGRHLRYVGMQGKVKSDGLVEWTELGLAKKLYRIGVDRFTTKFEHLHSNRSGT